MTPGMDDKVLLKSLTPEQKAKFGSYRDEFCSYIVSTGPADREKCRELIARIYANGSLPPPKKFYWVQSPMEGSQIAQKLLEVAGDPHASAEALEMACGSKDASWLAFYAFFARECSLDSVKAVLPMAEILKYCGWWWPFDEVCIISDRPVSVKLDADKQLHCEDGPAMLFSDGFAIYAKHGKTYTPKNVKKNHGLTKLISPDMITG